MARYTDKENVEIAQQEYENHKVGYSLETSGSGKYVGTLSDANNNRTNNGEQIFTYTKTSTGREAVPPTASAEERAQVKEITIMYQGSASPSNFFTNAEEFGRDWVFNDAPEFLNIIKGNLTGQSSKAPGQLEASAAYLKEMMEKYPNAKINLYGHSLGSMDVQYAIANVKDYDRINSVNIYQGPNIYSTLTPEQKANVSALYSKTNNYIDSNDMIGLGYNKGQGTVGKVYQFKGVKNSLENIDARRYDEVLPNGSILKPGQGNMLPYLFDVYKFGVPRWIFNRIVEGNDTHMWGGYRFDKDGNLIDVNSNQVQAWEKPEEVAKLEVLTKNEADAELLNRDNGLSIDVDRDGKLDAQFGKDRLMVSSLVPHADGATEIVINYENMSGLAANLNDLLVDIAQIRNLLTVSESTNSNVESRKAQRTQTLEQSIVSYLEQIQLIQSIKDLDNFYTKLENKKSAFSKISEYSTYQFSRQFDWLGTSGAREWCHKDGSHWDYHGVTRKLQTLITSTSNIKNSQTSIGTQNNNNPSVTGTGGSSLVVMSTKSAIANQGEATINSFKSSIGETFKGENIRSKFEDGIANPIRDVMAVELDNINKMEQCIVSMRDSVLAVANSHKQNDTTIEQNWRSNTDVMGNYQVGSVPTDFDTFVKQSDLFDDLEALKAFDSQVDNATKTLGDKMVSAFSVYLATAKTAITNTYSELSNIKAAGDAVENEFPTNIYYKPKENKKADPIYYQTVEASISISSTIKDVDKFIGDIEQDYSNTVRTIVSTSGDLSSLKTQLRTYLEEAIYNYATLSDVVKGQKAIGLIMKRIALQANDFAELLNSNRGKSIEALDGRMKEMGTMASNISTLVEKCFGNNG
ncbi:SA1320 family protein [Gemella sanguinis]